MRRDLIILLSLAAALPIWASSCGRILDQIAGAKLPNVAGARALSKHYVEVTFSKPASKEAEDPDGYVITAADSSRLNVRAANLSQDRTSVLLTTDALQVDTYTLTFDRSMNVADGEISFAASAIGTPEPRLDTAIALDANTVLLTLSERMDEEGTENVEFYRIFAENAETPLEDVAEVKILRAVLEESEITVRLTTSDLTNIKYTVKMTNATRGPGPFLINPDRNTQTFFGIRPDDFVPPRLVKAESTSSTSVLLTFSEPLRDASDAFSEPLRDESDDAGNFTISPTLVVTDAQLTKHNTQILLTTLTQVPDRLYTVTVANVKDIAGNVIKAGTVCIDNGDDCTTNADCNVNMDCVTSDTADFRGSSRELFVHSAIALNNTQVLLTFSEPMDPSTTACADRADCRAIYSISDPDNDRDVDIIIESALPDIGEGDRTVVLNTSSQENIVYTVRVSNVKAVRDDFLIDPTRNTADFLGIPTDDQNGPFVLRAVATDNTVVLVSFSEPLGGTGIQDVPVDGEPDDPSNYRITEAVCTEGHCDNGDPLFAGAECTDNSDCGVGGLCNTATAPNCPSLIIEDAEITTHDTQVLLHTLSQVVDVIYTVTVSNAKDKAGNDLVEPDSADFFGIPPTNNDLPRVIGAISTSNTTVVVTYNRDMGPSAAQPGNYFIVQENVQPEAGALVVVDAMFLPGQLNAVQLTTLSQNEVTYRVTAVNVRDRAGSQLAPRELLVDSTTVLFAGTPFGCPNLRRCINNSPGIDGQGACNSDDDCDDDRPCGPGEPDCTDQCVQPPIPCEGPDMDGDGLTDNEEQRGWVVRVTLTDGTVTERDVTSDPLVADTDGDGLTDRLEKLIVIDPRDPDTDDDLVSDFDEWNLHFTSPTDQDTDGDGMPDSSELMFFKTSPLLADTDGDAFDDGEELFELNRDPRVADVPRPRISVGDVALRLDTRFTFTDQLGVTRSSEQSVSSTLEQSRETSFSFTDTSTTTIAIEAGVEAGYSQSDGFAIKGNVGFSYTQENQTQFTNESKQASQETYERSLTTSETVDETQEVTREVVGASIDVALTIANIGDIAFTMTNLEVTALLQDPVDRNRFVPVATLVPSIQLITGEIPSITTGVFVPERGPFIFTSRDVFPSLVEDLLRDPRGLIFKVANFDVLDEFGRNFAFVEQSINEKTAGITIDSGNSRVDRFRVATYNSFDDIIRACDNGTPTTEGMRCSIDADCADVCNQGDCVSDQCSNDPSTDCTSNADCKLCSADPSTACTTTADCGGSDGRCARALCDDGDPATEGQACRIDADCGSGRCSEELLDSEFTGSFDDRGMARGVRMKNVLQDILGLVENASPDAITVGPNGCGETWASGDDIQVTPPSCLAVIRSDGLIVLPGPNGILNSAPVGDDVDTIRSVGDCSSNTNLKCTADGDCAGHACDTASCAPATCVGFACVGGTDDGDLCLLDSNCGGNACDGGPNADSTCTLDSQCGDCLGGSNNGGDCDADGDCPGQCVNMFDRAVIVDGGDGCAQTRPARDDQPAIKLLNGEEQVQQADCALGGPDGEIILAGPNGVLDTQIPSAVGATCDGGTCTNNVCSNRPCQACSANSDCPNLCSNNSAIECSAPSDCLVDDRIATISGYGTEVVGVCSGDSTTPGVSCDDDGDCTNGTCRKLQVLVRVNGIENESTNRCSADSAPDLIGRVCECDDDCGANGTCENVPDRFWLVLGSSDQVLGSDFDEIRLLPGDRIALAYVQDTDGDGLLRREEFLYGSSDFPPRGTNSDGCPILGSAAALGCIGLTFDSVRDFDEVRRGWEIKVVGPRSYFAYSDPTVPDSDLDRLFDDEEQTHGTDPRKRDTDDDGITDFDELNGYVFFDRDQLPAGQVPAYEGEVLLDGGNGIMESTVSASDIGVGICSSDSDNPGVFCDDENTNCPSGSCVLLDDGTNTVVGGRCRGGSDNVIRAGPSGKVQTFARTPSDDIQVVAFGTTAAGGDVVIITPGPDGILQSVPGDALGNGIVDDASADDHYGTRVGCTKTDNSQCADTCNAGTCTLNSSVTCSDAADCSGTCEALPGDVIALPGSDGRINTEPEGDDFIGQFHQSRFATDPLNRDTDADTLFDGVEANLGFLGANPNDPTDAADFRDDDRDGLVNREERDGWVPVYAVAHSASVATCNSGKCVGGGRKDEVCGKDAECKFKFVCREADGTEQTVSNPAANNLAELHPECVVLSDTFEPDSDFDGLGDLLEMIIGTNPKDSDTDGDTLLDFDELDPQSRFSIDPADFRLFDNRCRLVTRCPLFDIDTSQMFGTNLKGVDTDGDGRSDVDELFQPWTINVIGQDSYRVFSDALEADFDADGLNDLEEQSANRPTDPTKADTDGDSISDKRESELGTNPLEPDQKIRVGVSSITVVGNCDDNSVGEFRGTISLQVSDGAPETLVILGDYSEGAVISNPGGAAKTKFIREGDTVLVFSNQVTEWDPGSADEQLGSFQEFFTFPISGVLRVVNLMDEDDSCKLTIVISVVWVR